MLIQILLQVMTEPNYLIIILMLGTYTLQECVILHQHISVKCRSSIPLGQTSEPGILYIVVCLTAHSSLLSPASLSAKTSALRNLLILGTLLIAHEAEKMLPRSAAYTVLTKEGKALFPKQANSNKAIQKSMVNL